MYLTLTGASGFLAAPLDDELKSLLKLGMRGGKKAERRKKREIEIEKRGYRERQNTRTDMQTQAVAAAVLVIIRR